MRKTERFVDDCFVVALALMLIQLILELVAPDDVRGAVICAFIGMLYIVIAIACAKMKMWSIVAMAGIATLGMAISIVVHIVTK